MEDGRVGGIGGGCAGWAGEHKWLWGICANLVQKKVAMASTPTEGNKGSKGGRSGSGGICRVMDGECVV